MANSDLSVLIRDRDSMENIDDAFSPGFVSADATKTHPVKASSHFFIPFFLFPHVLVQVTANKLEL